MSAEGDGLWGSLLVFAVMEAPHVSRNAGIR
ncbi:hypothetical protein AM2010_1715 [Pelagerythrobacter marensis]|uniref:Uncharacterized protein n=1 Tax=Pelagerythrobacter marensis TaxID=543877 RepID=A0A0G3XAX3_9SPHN|nr:hypothetical protein AM2010_1715 [Pelagerythrobacter marensis]